MVIIHGETSSGKSNLALSLLNKSEKTLYFALDFDKRIKSLELNNKNIQVTAFPRGTYLADIEYEILNHGGLFQNRLSYVVIDPINFIKNENSIPEIILKLLKLEKEYNKFKLIVVINTLYHFGLNSIPEIEGGEIIKASKKGIITF